MTYERNMVAVRLVGMKERMIVEDKDKKIEC